MPRFLVQCILVVEANSPDDARGVVLEEASSQRWYPVKDVRTILGAWPDRGDPDASECPHGFGDDVVCLLCHPERREAARLPGFQNGEGMDAAAWLPVEDEEGYALVECEACRSRTLDENTDVCRNPACPTNDIVREAIATLEADAECHGCQQSPCICEEG